MKYYVQEIIGGWRQVAVFEGTFEECMDYKNERCFSGSWDIVSELDYKVDYL